MTKQKGVEGKVQVTFKVQGERGGRRIVVGLYVILSKGCPFAEEEIRCVPDGMDDRRYI